jgi:hypothetical protein
MDMPQRLARRRGGMCAITKKSMLYITNVLNINVASMRQSILRGVVG